MKNGLLIIAIPTLGGTVDLHRGSFALLNFAAVVTFSVLSFAYGTTRSKLHLLLATHSV